MAKNGKKRTILNLGSRERQVFEAVLFVGEGAVSDIVAAMPDSPTYSTVRVTLGELVKKELVEYRNVKNRYYYRATTSAESNRRSAISELLTGLFRGRASDVALTLFEVAGESLTTEELDRLSTMIEEAKQNRLDREGE